MSTRIYLAARYSRRNELRHYRADLQALGYEVTSRWLDGTHEIRGDLRAQAAHTERVRFAMEDWADLISADICISFTEQPRETNTRGGRHVEFGGALAMGKRCLVVGPYENVFHTLPVVVRFETWDEALKSLAPVVGAEGGAGSLQVPSPVASAEPGPEVIGPARASVEGDR